MKWLESAYLVEELSSKYPKQIMIVSYSQLITNTHKIVRDTFNFAGVLLTEQTTTFIDDSISNHSDDPYDIYKSKINDNSWMNSLPNQISNKILSNDKAQNLINIFNL